MPEGAKYNTFIKKTLEEFDTYELEHYGKSKIGRVEVKSFLSLKLQEAYEEGKKDFKEKLIELGKEALEQKPGHGYCLDCGKEVQPIMECKCKFRKTFIEKTLEELDKEFDLKCPDFHDPFTHINYPSTYIEKMFKIKDLKSFLSLKLQEAFDEGKKEGFENGMREFLNDPDYQKKIRKQTIEEIVGVIEKRLEDVDKNEALIREHNLLVGLLTKIKEIK